MEQIVGGFIFFVKLTISRGSPKLLLVWSPCKEQFNGKCRDIFTIQDITDPTTTETKTQMHLQLYTDRGP